MDHFPDYASQYNVSFTITIQYYSCYQLLRKKTCPLSGLLRLLLGVWAPGGTAQLELGTIGTQSYQPQYVGPRVMKH